MDSRPSREALAAALAIDWTPFWRETPIEEPDGVHSMSMMFDRLAFADAILAALPPEPPSDPERLDWRAIVALARGYGHAPDANTDPGLTRMRLDALCDRILVAARLNDTAPENES